MNRPKPRVTTALLLRRARALSRHLPSAIAGDYNGVHQARVASRRLREAVPVLTSGLKRSKAAKARRKIRRLTRALGTVRELDVTLKILDELARRDGMPRNALEDVRGRVIAERDSRRETMLERLEEVNALKLNRRLVSVAEALQQTDSDTWREVLASLLMTRAKRLSAAIGAAGRMYAPERLHGVRITAKKLRYALEIAAESGVVAARPLVRSIKRTQDTLGRLHDLQVLQAHVAAVQAAPPGRRSGSDDGLEAIARTLEDECRHLHARYVATVPALGELVETCRSVVAPHVVHPPRRRRPLKMALAVRAPRAAGGRG
jgi:CHAD domain-containing protein